MVDSNTLLHYTNVLYAVVDSVYFSMKNLNVTDVVVLVIETGWPSKGDSKEPYATIDNRNLEHDFRSPPISEAHWGLFYGNSTPVYLLHVSRSGTFLANDTTNQTYCIATEGTETKTLQSALDWACGPGRANCANIQAGKNCYQPDGCRVARQLHGSTSMVVELLGNDNGSTSS
ncbi:Glucan endo-1 [Abeliophyllum distichum]|uniref:Glucan endo-1 n=1 Tax=Abeliophyllum distichum TaxID=126358 RepID=A0ABD1QXI4_9LAMI